MNSMISPEEHDRLTPFWRKRRFVVAVLIFFGFFNAYSLKINLNLGVVAMTEVKNVTLANGTMVQEADFQWNSKERGLILSSFFYGYIVTPIVGGYIASKLGGHLTFGVGFAGASILTLLTSVAAKADVKLLVALRVLEGLFEGVAFPAQAEILSKWAPPLERSRMLTMSMSGSYLGNIVTMLVCGVLAEEAGWESIFYVFGAIGCIWSVFFFLFVKESPQKDSGCSKLEAQYITDSLNTPSKTAPKNYPWKKILTSAPVWALLITHFTGDWGYFIILTQLPMFLNDVMHLNLEHSGFVSALPYVSLFVFINVGGYLADLLQVKGYLTTIQSRKYFTVVGFIGPTVFLFLAAFILHPTWSIVFIVIGIGFNGLGHCGYLPNYLDLAPQYASVVYGLGKTGSALAGLVSPIVTGYIVQNKGESEWKIVFYIAALFYVIGAASFWFFASAEIQPWAQENAKKSKDIRLEQL